MATIINYYKNYTQPYNQLKISIFHLFFTTT